MRPNINKIVIGDVKLWDQKWVFKVTPLEQKNKWDISRWCGFNGTHKITLSEFNIGGALILVGVARP